MKSAFVEPAGRIGLFGGTFDPPHRGHIETALKAADELHLDQLAFLPAPHPPHKKDHEHTPYPLRRAMVERCLPLDLRFRICLIEEQELPGTTLETIRGLRRIGFTEDRCHLIWIMGSDSLLDLPAWHQPDDILDNIEVAVLPRPGFSVSEAEERFKKRITILHTPLIDISATELRRGEKPLEENVPLPVSDFIRIHHLYGQ